MRSPRFPTGLVLLATLGVAGMGMPGCRGKQENRAGPPLATLGGRVLHESDFQSYLAETFPDDQVAAIGHSSAKRQEALEAFFDTSALLEKARRVGIPRELRFQKAVALGEMKLLAQRMTERNREAILRDSQVSPEAVRRYYEEHQHDFPVETGFSMRWVVVYVRGNPAFPEQGLPDRQARAKARRALLELRRGVGWEAVAKRYSDEVGSRDKGGLVPRGQFGLFAKEVEAAVRTQPLGEPGKPIRTVFGYHVVEVVDRLTDPVPKPFDEVRPLIEARLGDEQAAVARRRFMDPIQNEIGFAVTEIGQRDGSLLNQDLVPPDSVLARIGGTPVLESDFQWFLKDAFLPAQRISVFGRPGARQGLVRSFLDMRLLEAKARRQGLHNQVDFALDKARIERRLLIEFIAERVKVGPACQCGDTAEARRAVERPRLDAIRTEVGFSRAR